MALRNVAFITQQTDVSELFFGNCLITLRVLYTHASSLLASSFNHCHLSLEKNEADSEKMAMPLHCGSFTAAVGRKSSFHKGTVQLLEVKEAVLEFQVIQRRSDIVSVPKSANTHWKIHP